MLWDGCTIKETDVLDRLRELDPAHSMIYGNGDDISSATLFADVFGKVIRYNATMKEWYVYDGVKWSPDVGNLFAESFAKLLARSLWLYSADIQDKAFINFVYRLQDRSKRKIMIEDARDLLPVRQEDFDTDPYLFNVQNGVLNLKDGTFIDHDPDLLLSKVANVSYNPDASCADFDAFMNGIMKGDLDKIKYLQTLIGYALTGTNEREECYFLYGATTRNGKGTFTNTINYLFGDYGGNVQPETLAKRERKGNQASGDIARLQGIRFLQMSEPPKRMRIDVALLKTLTGRDVITARFLYRDDFEFTPCFKLFVNTNYLPVVLDDTLFSSGRVKVITFDRHFAESEQDKGLKDRLTSPESLSGILNWCLTGLKYYQTDGRTVTTPVAVQNATDDYRAKSDKMQSFIDEVLIEHDVLSITAKDAYEAFAKWCRAKDYGVDTKGDFMDDLRSKGLLSDTGTVAGKTCRNVIKNHVVDTDALKSHEYGDEC